MIAPSRNASSTLPMAAAMKFACLNKILSMLTPWGRLRFKSAKALSTSRVNCTVSCPGCFCTDKITAGLPMKLASPRLTPAAKSTFATCCNKIGTLSRCATTNWRMSSKRVVRPMLRIKYSCACASKKPPLVLLAKPLSAAWICVRLMFKRSIFATSGVMRYCCTSPPMGMTCDTPLMLNKRGRTTQSAKLRTSIGDAAPSEVIATNRISPIMELIGDICGTISAGN